MLAQGSGQALEGLGGDILRNLGREQVGQRLFLRGQGLGRGVAPVINVQLPRLLCQQALFVLCRVQQRAGTLPLAQAGKGGALLS